MLRWTRSMFSWRKLALAALTVVLVLSAGLLTWLLPPILYDKINNEALRGVAKVWIRIGLVVLLLLALGIALDAPRRRWWLRATGIIGGFIGLAGIILVVWLVPPMLYKYVPGQKDRATAEASTRTGFLAGLVGLAALGGLAINARTLRETQRANRETHRLELQGQLSERYTQAIGQLGSKQVGVRIGAIYALERIAVDSVRDRSTVFDVLSWYIRDYSHKQPLGPDVQAAIKAIRDTRMSLRSIDLADASLVGIDVSGSDLVKANLARADLAGAILTEAKLVEANLYGANLTGASLSRADPMPAALRGNG